MRVIIEHNYDAMSRWAANHIVERINAFKPTAEKPFILGIYFYYNSSFLYFIHHLLQLL